MPAEAHRHSTSLSQAVRSAIPLILKELGKVITVMSAISSRSRDALRLSTTSVAPARVPISTDWS